MSEARSLFSWGFLLVYGPVLCTAGFFLPLALPRRRIASAGSTA